MATMTQTRTVPRVMSVETTVPLVAGDVLRAIDTPAVSPPVVSPPPAVPVTSNATNNTHRRTSSAASDRAKASPSPTTSIGSAAKKGHRRHSSAASDIAKAAGIDLEAVSMAEARKIMSEEHKILGFRPPHGSFAAEVQSVAAKHPEGKPEVPIDTGKLKEIAREDALRILAERKSSTGGDISPPNGKVTSADKHPAPARHSPPNPGVNLNKLSATDARILMSHEHRALGFRPPPGSLAAEAQSAAARHPDGDGTHLDEETLKEIALRDAERIKADRELNMVGEVNVSTVGKEGASEIVSAEARELGHRPPSGSIAAEAQSAGDKHPAGGTFNPSANPVEMDALKEAAKKEGAELREAEAATGTNEGAPSSDSKAESTTTMTPTTAAKTEADVQASPSKVDKALQTEPEPEPEPKPEREQTVVAAKVGQVVKDAVERRREVPPLERMETGDSVEIVCEVLA